jgi:hypothetical protein
VGTWLRKKVLTTFSFIYDYPAVKKVGDGKDLAVTQNRKGGGKTFSVPTV